MMTSLLFYALGVTIMAPYTFSKVVDLSHKHGPTTLTSAYDAPRYNLTNLHKGIILDVFIEFNYYGSSEHSGTHMDAPSHFIQGGMTLDNVPLEHTILDGVMLDFSVEAARNNNFSVTVQMIESWEKKFGKIPKESAVLFYFGWYTKFNNENLYTGTIDKGDYLTYVYPYVTEEAGKWLLDKRNIRTLGSDTISVDPFQLNGKPSKFPIHQYLLSRNRILIENLRDLDKLPATGFRFHAAPVKYVGASGAQVRAYAVIHDVMENSSQSVHMSQILAVCFAAVMNMLL